MPNPVDTDPSIRDLSAEGRLDDVIMQYSKTSLFEGGSDTNTQYTSVRRIEVTIIEERADEIEAHLEVVDNTNEGIYAMFYSHENYPPKDKYDEFSERVVFDKADIPYYQDDFPNVQSHIPIGTRIAPAVKEWSQSQPFRA